jgi:ATP-dependent helicase/nuclease subunit A
MSQLTIYKASAGSGKTFTLTRNFLTLLFQDNDNYKHILAATFTNKATEEMKNRIISELYTLAQGEE